MGRLFQLSYFAYFGKVQARKKAQQVKAPATKPNGLSSVSGIHRVEGENQLPFAISLSATYMCYCAYPHIHTQTLKCKKIRVF